MPNKPIYTSNDVITLSGLTPGKSVFLFTKSHYYNFGKISTDLSLGYANVLIGLFDRTKKDIQDFYGENMHIMCDGRISRTFNIQGITMTPFQSVYNYGDNIALSNHSAKSVFLVTPSITDPLRYYRNLGITSNVSLGMNTLKRFSDHSKRPIHEFYGRPCQLVCNGVSSRTFTITGATMTPDKEEYASTDKITLSNLTDGKPVYLTTPSNSDKARYYKNFGVTTTIQLSPNIVLTCVADNTTKLLSEFYGDPFYFACNNTEATHSFTITGATMTPDKEEYASTDKITLSNLPGGKPVYLTTPSNSDKARYYKNFGVTTTIQLSPNIVLTCVADNTTKLLSEFYGDPFYFACNNTEVTHSFTITETPSTQSISLQWNTVYEDNMALMKAGLYNTTAVYAYAYPLRPEDISTKPSTSSSTPLPPVKKPTCNTIQ